MQSFRSSGKARRRSRSQSFMAEGVRVQSMDSFMLNRPRAMTEGEYVARQTRF